MEIDYSESGNETLENLDNAKRFTEWMYSHVYPYLQGTILEIGSGTGTYSKKILRDFPNNQIILSEIDPHYMTKLSSEFSSEKVSVMSLDIESGIGSLTPNSIDSIFALNVFEHIKDDEKAMQNVFTLLKPGGHFIMLVPAHPSLYNRIDASINHYRRYTKSITKDKAYRTGFIVKKAYYFNFLSIFGWWLNGNVLKKETLDSGLLSLFDKLVPLLRFIEKYILRGTLGISVITIMQKPTR
jgi:SAM-dependent methyltransferase